MLLLRAARLSALLLGLAVLTHLHEAARRRIVGRRAMLNRAHTVVVDDGLRVTAAATGALLVQGAGGHGRRVDLAVLQGSRVVVLLARGHCALRQSHIH